VSAVEGVGFLKLLNTLEPRFQVPGGNFLSRTEIPTDAAKKFYLSNLCY